MKFVLAALTLASILAGTPGVTQTVDPSAPGQAASEVEDIVVEGRPLREATVAFVDSVAAPAAGGASGAAAWRQTLCIGVGNLQREAADHIIERISATAVGLGVHMGRPGCEPRVFINFTADANEATRALVASRRREFRINMTGADRGGRALARFQNTEAPVRWWHVSIPVDMDTGISANRRPGDEPFSPPGADITRPNQLGDNTRFVTASMLRNDLRDDLAQVIIVVDVDKIGGASIDQLAAYLTMVSLVQVDPEAEPRGYDTILNLFDQPERAPATLTAWDMAFLGGVYGAEQAQLSTQARLGAVAAAMAQSVRNQQARAPE
jgi:hypothetical protein